jgi:hypothetical protein
MLRKDGLLCVLIHSNENTAERNESKLRSTLKKLQSGFPNYNHMKEKERANLRNRT